MPWLKFYEKERQMFPEAFSHKVSDEGARIIIKKLKRHFKELRPYPIKIRFRGNRALGSFSSGWYGNMIRLGHNPSVGMICHELAHMFNQIKYRNWNHNKKLLHTIKRMIHYCEKKNYWKEEIARRIRSK